jgi:hypothetical protein
MKKRTINAIILFVIILSFITLSYFVAISSPAIFIHESAHCLGANLMGNSCRIKDNTTFLNNPASNEPFFAFFYSGMPYLFMFFFSLFIFLFRNKITKIKVLREFVLLICFLFYWNIAGNFLLINKSGNDFLNILKYGLPIEFILIFLVIVLSVLLIIGYLFSFCKYFLFQNKNT